MRTTHSNESVRTLSLTKPFACRFGAAARIGGCCAATLSFHRSGTRPFRRISSFKIVGLCSSHWMWQRELPCVARR